MGLLLRRRLIVPLLAFVVSAPALAQTADIPARTDNNLIVAVYNIQWLGQKAHELGKLADVIEHFDVTGIVEVKKEEAVAKLVAELETKTGKDWGYTFGVRTQRPYGTYHEAYAVVWRTDRVTLEGLVGGVWDRHEAFRNDPYIVSFRRKAFDFSMILVHTRWTDDRDGSRASEVLELGEQVKWLRGFLPEKDILVAGDFNYPGTKTVMKKFATTGGLLQVDANPKTTFKSNNTGYANSYDHIYISESHTSEYIAGSAAAIDTTKIIYGDNSVSSMAASKKELSDHLPVIAVFDVSGQDDD